MSNTFKKWYQTATVVGDDNPFDTGASSSEKDRWYQAILIQLTSYTGKVFESMEDAFNSYFNRLGENVLPEDLLIVLKIFLDSIGNAQSNVTGMIRGSNWFDELRGYYEKLKSQVAVVQLIKDKGGSEKAIAQFWKDHPPETIQSWTSIWKACKTIDDVHENWDGHVETWGEKAQAMYKRIIKSALGPNPMVVDALKEQAKMWEDVIPWKEILIGGGVIIGGVLVISKVGSAVGSVPSRATQVFNRTTSQAQRVADKIMAKGGK